MTVTVSQEINAPRERVWQLITDTDSWTDTITAIHSVEVLDRPATGVVGLKWKETRTMFGKEATETMWITAAEPNQWYETRAESHGMIYKTRVAVDDANDKTRLSMQFSGEPVTFGAKVMSLMSFMFNGTIRKCLKEDLADIRQVAEKT